MNKKYYHIDFELNTKIEVSKAYFKAFEKYWQSSRNKNKIIELGKFLVRYKHLYGT